MRDEVVGQGAVSRGLDLARALAQLGRDVRQAEPPVELRLVLARGALEIHPPLAGERLEGVEVGLGAGGGQERRGPVIGRGHAQLEREAAHERGARGQPVAGAARDQERGGERGVEGGVGLARRQDDDQPVHRLRPPAQVAGHLGGRHARDRAQVGEHPLGHVQGLGQQHAAGRGRLLRSGIERADALEDAPLGLLAEAFHRAHAPGLAGGPERLHGLHAQRGVERLDLAKPEVRDPAELAGAGGERAPDLLERLRSTATGQLPDHRGQALADTGQRGQPGFGHEPLEVRVGQALQHPGATLVGAGAERLAAGQGEQIGRLAEGARDGKAIHLRIS